MLKKTFLKLNESKLPKATQEILNAPKSKYIEDKYKSNSEVLEVLKESSYEIRGEYLPRRKINPFKRKPLTVAYDQHQFSRFVLPSERKNHYGVFDQEELFGIKRWRNDSPFIKEYVKVDNQLFGLILFGWLLIICFYKARMDRYYKLLGEAYKSDMGYYDQSDLI